MGQGFRIFLRPSDLFRAITVGDGFSGFLDEVIGLIFYDRRGHRQRYSHLRIRQRLRNGLLGPDCRRHRRIGETDNFQVVILRGIAGDDDVNEPVDFLANVVCGLAENLSLGVAVGRGKRGNLLCGKVVEGGSVGENQHCLAGLFAGQAGLEFLQAQGGEPFGQFQLAQLFG